MATDNAEAVCSFTLDSTFSPGGDARGLEKSSAPAH